MIGPTGCGGRIGDLVGSLFYVSHGIGVGERREDVDGCVEVVAGKN